MPEVTVKIGDMWTSSGHSIIDQIEEGQLKLTLDFNGKIDVFYTNLSIKIEALNARLTKVEVQVVQTREDVKRHEALIKGKKALKYYVNSIIEDDFWQGVKEEKLQEGEFDVESSMSFSNSHLCRPRPTDEYRSMEWDEHRSTSDVQHRSTGSVASGETVRIMTHEKFVARHPHPPKPLHVNIDRHSKQVTDRQRDSIGDRQLTSVIDRRAPLCYQVQLPKIDVARLNALRNPSQPSETPTHNISEQSEEAPEPMQVDQANVGRTLRKRKEKVSKHLKR